MYEDWELIACFLILFIASAGLGAGFYIAQKVVRYMTGFDDSRRYIKQRKCDHVFQPVCRICGLRKD